MALRAASTTVSSPLSGVRIGLDLDEVLGHYVDALSTWHNAVHGPVEGKGHLERHHWNSYEFHNVWGGTVAETNVKMNAFHDTSHIDELSLVPGAFEGIATLKSKGASLVVVTSRQTTLEERTKQWLLKNFPEDTFDEIRLGNHYGASGVKRSKAELCEELGAAVLVDDAPKYIRNVHSSTKDVHAVLFDHHGTYPWSAMDSNELSSMGDRVRRAEKWDEVVEHVLDWAPKLKNLKQ